MAAQDPYLVVERFSDEGIIGIDERHELTARIRETKIASRAHAEVGVPGVLDITNSLRIPFHVTSRDLGAAVARAVVDQDELPVHQGLREHAPDGLLEERGGILEDDDD
jgi:hypothetical protein